MLLTAASAPEYVKQEIWANLIAYNMTEMLVNCAVIEKKETKYEYKVNFTRAAHICRVFLRLATEKDRIIIKICYCSLRNVIKLAQQHMAYYGKDGKNRTSGY